MNIKLKNVKITETYDDVEDELQKLARIIAQNSTVGLFYKYRRNKDTIYKEMDEHGQKKLADLFSNIMDRIQDRPFTYKLLLSEIEKLDDELLFMPYGVLKPPFNKSTKEFIHKAKNEREAVPHRNTYRLLIKKRSKKWFFRKKDEKLIGGFVVDTLPIVKDFNTYQMGDLGIFLHPKETCYQYEIMLKLYNRLRCNIMDSHITNMSNEDNKIVPLPDIIITATTHPLNYNTIALLERLGFKEYSRGDDDNYKEPRIVYTTCWAELKEIISKDKIFQKIAKKCKIRLS